MKALKDISYLCRLIHLHLIIDVLDDQLVSTRRGGFQKFLVRWEDRPISEASWITSTDFQLINPDLFERYQAIH